MQLRDKQNYIQQQKADLSGCLSLQLVFCLSLKRWETFVGLQEILYNDSDDRYHVQLSDLIKANTAKETF